MNCIRHCERSAAIHKEGFTLMELLVYMAIVGIIVVIAGEAFSNSTKFRVRTDNMIRATQEAENVAMLFKEDAAQLGAKSSREAGDAALGAEYGVQFSAVNENVYMDPNNVDEDQRDFSSFTITTTDGMSDVKFRRLRYDENGYYEAVEEVRWFVENNVLKRSCKLLAKKVGLVVANDDPCSDVEAADKTPVEMATSVDSFYVIPATPGVVDETLQQIFPPNNATQFRLIPRTDDIKLASFRTENAGGEENGGGTSVIIRDFVSNFNVSTEQVFDSPNQKINQAFAVKNEDDAVAVWSNMCSSYGNLTLEANQVYEISFNVPYPGDDDKSLVFVPGKDHMSVGFRVIGTGDYPRLNGKKLIDDFLFFPPLDSRGNGVRSMRFSVPQQISNVCLAFTFACYSPLVSQGRITIENLRVNKVATATYTFDDPPFDAEAHKKLKQNVKALQLLLKVSRGKKNGGPGETGRVLIAVPIPSNGPSD